MRDNDTHQTSRRIANAVVVEALNTKAMTALAKGMVEGPGRTGKAKSDFNRPLLVRGRGQLERKPDYKTGTLVKVDSAYTSQTCSACGYTSLRSRPSQAVFACGSCGHHANTDHNAAVNSLARADLSPCVRSARGAEASARRGAFPLGTPTPRELRCRAGQASTCPVMYIVP